MLLLAFDTATPAVTVALVRRDEGSDSTVLAESFEVDARRQGELLAPSIEAVLADAGADRRDLTAVVVGVGPGPFTGLRVGVVTARVLGHALGIPVHGVCTLDAIALAAAGAVTDAFVVATDARRREVYWARYDGAGRMPTRTAGPAVNRPAAVATELPTVGAGAVLYPEAFPDNRGFPYPAAADLARHVIAGGPVLPATPLYLRRPDAAEPGAAKAVLA